MVENAVELVHGVGAEGIPHLGSVECHSNRAHVVCPVIGDVGQVEARHRLPGRRIEDVRDHGSSIGWPPGDTVVTHDSRDSIPMAFPGCC
jgi:hypothetical protein